MEFCSDFRYDLERGQIGEQYLAEILENAKIEVKTDFQAHETGNVFVEYESRGKPSGLATTQADWWAFVIATSRIKMIRTDELRALCRNYLKSNRDTVGGDNNTSKGILLPITQL